MSCRVYQFFPPRGHKPPLIFRDCLNPHLCLQHRRFPIPRYAKRPDVALYATGPPFLVPTPSSPHCTLKFSEHGSVCQPPAVPLDERPRPQKSSRVQRCLNAITLGYLKGTDIRGHPMIWPLALCPDCEARPGGVWCRVLSSVPGEGSTNCIYTGGSRWPQPLPFGS